MFYARSYRRLNACVRVIVNNTQIILPIGCLYSIVASFIGLCGCSISVCACVCTIYTFSLSGCCFFLVHYTAVGSGAGLIHNKSSRMLSVKIHISLSNNKQKGSKKAKRTEARTHTKTVRRECGKTTSYAAAQRSIQSPQIFSVQFCLVRCRVIVNL